MDTAQRNIMFQVQFWGLIGPLIALFTLLVIFVKSPTSAIELSFITIIGLLAAWKWKLQGLAVSLGATFLLYIYQFSTIENDEHLWHIGMNISIVMGCAIAALSYREVENLLHFNDVKGDATIDAKTASIDYSEVNRLKSNISLLEVDVAAKVKQIHSYEILVDHVKIEMIKTNQQHEKLLDEFFQKQNQLSLVQEQLNDATHHIEILSQKSSTELKLAEVKVDDDLQKELATKNNRISSLEKIIEDLQIEIKSNSNTPTKPCQHDTEIQELKSTNELLSRERGRLETCLFRTQIDLHQKTQDLANFPTLQADFELLETKNNLLTVKLKEAENLLEEKEAALESALTNSANADSIKDSEIFQGLENEKQNLIQALEAIENDLQSECQKNETLKAEIAEYENTLSNKLELFKVLEIEAKTLKQELQALENDLRSDLKSECQKNEALKAALAEKENAFKTQLELAKSLENEAEKLKHELQTLKNDLRNELDTECQKNEALKAAVAEKEMALETQSKLVNDLENEAEKLKQELQTLENDLRNDLKSECLKNEALNAAVAEYESEKNNTLIAFQDLEIQSQNLKQALQAVEDDLGQECQKYEALKAVIAEKENELQTKLDSFKDLENESQNLKQAYQVLENDLRNDLRSELQKNEVLKAVVAEKEHELQTNFKSFKDLENESQNLKQAYQVLENDLRNDLRSELQKNEALRAAVEEKEHALENNSKLFKDLENEKQLLSQNLKNLDANLNSECQKNEALKKSLEEVISNLELQKQNLKSDSNPPISQIESNEFKELHFNYKKVEGKYNQLKEQFEQKSEVLNETRRQLFRAEEKFMQLKLDYDEESIYQLTESTASMEQHILNIWNESHEKIQELNQEINALQSIITSLIK